MSRVLETSETLSILPSYPGFSVEFSHHIYRCLSCQDMGTAKFAPNHVCSSKSSDASDS